MNLTELRCVVEYRFNCFVSKLPHKSGPMIRIAPLRTTTLKRLARQAELMRRRADELVAAMNQLAKAEKARTTSRRPR
jgi:hypothetical protein